MDNQAKKILAKLPDTPGVYIFKHADKILYIGKATSLRDRVRSYMSKGTFDSRGPLITKMLGEFDNIEHIKTDSVLEALVLEASLIKKYQPEANIKEKDNKSFNFVVITKEDFPRVLIVRGRELMDSNVNTSSLSIYRKRLNSTDFKIQYSFGPFPNGNQLKEAMKIVRKMFPFRDKCIPCIIQRQSVKSLHKSATCRPCFSRQVGLCPGVCTGEISKEEYAERVKNIILFFEGNKKKLMKNLEKQMQSFAKDKHFEEANIAKRTLFTLNHIQDISLLKDDISHGVYPLDGRLQGGSQVRQVGIRIESYDIAHMSGQNVVGVMTVVEGGEVKKSDYRKFKIKNDPGVNDTKALSEVLERRLAHIEWKFPDLIVVDGGIAQKNVVEKILSKNNLKILVVSVVKDERHRPREIIGDRSIALTTGKKWSEIEKEILLSNAEAHRYGIAFHKQLRGKIK